MFCANCGKQIKDGSKFCIYCGAAQGMAPAPVTPPRVVMQLPQQPQPAAVAVKPKKKKPVAAIVAVVLVLVAALAAAGYFVVLPMVHRRQWQTVMQDAEQALADQNYSSAVRTLEEADEILPDQPETQVQLARACAGAGDLEQAQAYMQALSDAWVSREKDPEEDARDPKATLRIGRSEQINGETTVYCAYASRPADAAHCLTVFGYRGDTSFKSEEQYYDENWNLLHQNEYYETGAEKNRRVLTYNDSGKTSTAEVWEFTEDGGFNEHYLHSYDANGNLAKSVQYEKDGSVSQSTEYTFDDDRKELNYTVYDGKGSMEYRKEFTYDTDGYLLSVIIYNPDGSIQSGRLYTNDEHGNPVTVTDLQTDGTEVPSQTYTYTYDADGNILTEKIYTVSTKETEQNTYTYREDGSRESKTHYNAQGVVKSVTKYDSHGFTIQDIFNDDDGKEKSSTSYTYINSYFTGYSGSDRDGNTKDIRYYYVDPNLLNASMAE